MKEADIYDVNLSKRKIRKICPELTYVAGDTNLDAYQVSTVMRLASSADVMADADKFFPYYEQAKLKALKRGKKLPNTKIWMQAALRAFFDTARQENFDILNDKEIRNEILVIFDTVRSELSIRLRGTETASPSPFFREQIVQHSNGKLRTYKSVCPGQSLAPKWFDTALEVLRRADSELPDSNSAKVEL